MYMYTNHVMDSKGRHAQGCKASLPSDEAGMGQGKRHKVNDLCRRIQESNPMRWRLVFFWLEVCPPATVIKVFSIVSVILMLQVPSAL